MELSVKEEGWALTTTYLRKRGIFSTSTRATVVLLGDRFLCFSHCAVGDLR